MLLNIFFISIFPLFWDLEKILLEMDNVCVGHNNRDFLKMPELIISDIRSEWKNYHISRSFEFSRSDQLSTLGRCKICTRQVTYPADR